MEALGYIAAIFIGIVLGLIGGGGSILTVPVLVYLMGIDAVLATAYSLFVVGASSAVGAVNNYRQGLIDVRTAVVFAMPSLVAVYLTRLFLVPSIPVLLFSIGNLTVTRDLAIMMLFAVVMVIAAVSMLRGKSCDTPAADTDARKPYNYPLIATEGVGVGILTGIVAAGGGFLILPALVLLVRLPMKVAVGTSLLIITVKSLIGFLGDLQAGQDIAWDFLGVFTGLAVLGIVIGSFLGQFIPGHKLKRGFGWFVLLMAAVIIWQELTQGP